MTYSPKIPLDTPSPSVIVSQIQTNFAQYQTVFDVNHTDLNNKNSGDHETVIIVKQVSSADRPIIGDQTILYAKNYTSNIDKQPQLFTKIPKFLPNKQDSTQATNSGMQLTYNEVNTVGPQYQSFIAGAYLVFIGFTNSIVSNITLSPSPAEIVSVFVTASAVQAGNPVYYQVSANIVSNDTFKIYAKGNPATVTYYWTAIAIA